MIKSVHFKNFKVLRNATLPLSRFTLIVGPNGSGKSTAMQAFPFAVNPGNFQYEKVVTAGLGRNTEGVEVTINWIVDGINITSKSGYLKHPNQVGFYYPSGPNFVAPTGVQTSDEQIYELRETLSRFRVFSFDAQAISVPTHLQPGTELGPNGQNLAGVLDDLRDKEPERFEALNDELERWLPEFDRILFETPSQEMRAFMLRTRVGQHHIQAADLSHGTLFALAFLTLAYLPNPPLIVCFEEPEHGIHPRLLREIRDSMYRLSYPENYGEKRKPVQVIATTHSPYLLDLYKDHPEEIVIAEKEGQETKFARLSEKPNVEDFLQDAPLGEVWYSGILGGVPSRP